jgi:hypothetical protein
VSLSLPEQLRIGLGASYALLVRVNGAKVTHWQMQTWNSSNPSLPWQQALTAISSWLAELKPRGMRITATLSAELAPLHLLPWRDDAISAEQQALLASTHFRRIHGESIGHRKIIAQPSGYGQPWLACAMDEELLQALTGQLHGAKLVSVQPLPVSLFNALHARLTAPACWLLVPEPDCITALHIRKGQWNLLQTLPAAAFHGESPNELLQRETRLAGLPDMPASIYSVASIAPGGISLDAGWLRSGAMSPDSPLHLLGGRR